MKALPTNEERAICLAQTEAALVLACVNVPTATKVREMPGWTDEETGEQYDPEWVVEIRFGRPATWFVTLDFESWRAMSRTPGCWEDVVVLEAGHSCP